MYITYLFSLEMGSVVSKDGALGMLLPVKTGVRSLNRAFIITAKHSQNSNYTKINKEWEVITLEQLTSHVEQAHNNRDLSRLR